MKNPVPKAQENFAQTVGRNPPTENGGDEYSSVKKTARVDPVSRYLQKTFTYSGRAPRGEFWWPVVFCWFPVNLLAGVSANALDFNTLIGNVVGGFLLIIYLFLILASVAAMVRRLHDQNLSGWWLYGFGIASVVLSFRPENQALQITFVGLLSFYWCGLLVLMTRRGNPDINKYGPPNDNG